MYLNIYIYIFNNVLQLLIYLYILTNRPIIAILYILKNNILQFIEYMQINI